jgi:hypothetical protein
MKVTKWSTLTGDLNVSEHTPEQPSHQQAAVDTGSAFPPLSDTPIDAVGLSMQGSKTEAIASEAPEAAAIAIAQVEAKAEEALPEAPKAEAPVLDGNVVLFSPGEHKTEGTAAEPPPESDRGLFGKQRRSAVAAVVALAMAAGALGGAMAAGGVWYFAGAARHDKGALQASVARIEANVLALTTSAEHTSKLGLAQYSKASDRLDKLEKAQAEPAAKIAKLTDAVDKLRASSLASASGIASPAAAAAAPAISKEVTGSIAPLAAPASSTAPPKTEVARLPTLDGWVLRDVAHGGALIESRQGMFEVYAGDPVPGLGRVDAIRRQDGRWVVVTTKGLVVAR